nr:MAG TPA: hypothetical protein [Caudoviricetes sp.]
MSPIIRFFQALIPANLRQLAFFCRKNTETIKNDFGLLF